MRGCTRAVIASGAKQSRTGEPQATGLPRLSLRSLLAITNGVVVQPAETSLEELVV